MRARPASFLALVFILLFAASAFAEGSYWQLVFSYDQSGLRLVSSAPIPPMRKAVVTPGLAGAPMKLGCTAEWLDAAGSAMTVTDFQLPVGIRSAPAADSPCETIIPETGLLVVRIAGPSSATAAAALRVSRKQSLDRVSGPWQAPAGLQFRSAQFPVAVSAPRQGPVGSEKIRSTGPDGNRLVIVILGDGFTAADLATGIFTNAANNALTAFEAKAPWDAMFNGTNVYRIDVESNESGSDNDPLGTYKDTYFNSSFYGNDIERLLYIDYTGYNRAVTAANAVAGMGMWDVLLVLVNSTRYGGSGGSVATSSLHSAAPEVVLHELGHSFADLADEYTSAYPGYPPGDGEPNVDYDYSGAGLKWLSWVTPGIPLPTPNSSMYSGQIGAFEGARYLTTGIYRPSYNCLMRSLGVSLDAVCQEAHLRSYLLSTTLADSTIPKGTVSTKVTFTGSDFAAAPNPLGPMSYEWRLNGAALTGATDSAVHLTTRDFYDVHAGASTTLQLVMSYPTTRMRLWQDTEYYQWTVIADCNGNGVADNIDISGGYSKDVNHNGIPDECDQIICCKGTRGNVDGDALDKVNLVDLSSLIGFLTGGPFVPPCTKEADVTGDGKTNLVDLSSLISYLTGGPFVPPACP